MKNINSNWIRKLKILSGNKHFYAIGLILIPIYLAYQNILNGQFWMLDDHVMINAFEQTKNLDTVERLRSLLKLCHVNYFPDDGRLNPTLSLLYALRVFFFGTSASLYFGLNFLILCLTSIAFYHLLVTLRMSFTATETLVIEKITIAVFCFSIFTVSQIISNFVTLGTSELIGPLFLFIVINLMIKRTILEKKSTLDKVLLIINSFLLAGVKENYAITLLLIQIVFFYVGFRLSKLDIKLNLFLISLTLFFVIQIIYVSQNRGTDVYGNEVGLAFVFMTLLKVFSNKYGFAIILIHLMTLFLVHRNKANLNVHLKSLTLIPSLIFLSDWIVYRGDIRDRYATNTAISLFLGVYILSMLFAMTNRSRFVSTAAVLITCLAIISYELPSGISSVHRKVLATEHFQKGLRAIKSSGMGDTSLPIAFIAQSDWDYESIFSFAIFMNFKGLKNSLILELSPEFPVNSTNTSTFKVWSEKGITDLYEAKGDKSGEYITCVYSQNSPKERFEGCRDEIILKWLP